MERITTLRPGIRAISTGRHSSAYVYSQFRADLGFQTAYGTELPAHQLYLQGKKDGIKDLQEEASKMAKALFEMALQKAESLTDALLQVAHDNKITINKFCLRMESWEKISMLIIVKLEDYLNDKIELLYEAANQLILDYNTEKFMWEYVITYSAESLSMEKIISEGYTMVYEPTAEPRKAQ